MDTSAFSTAVGRVCGAGVACLAPLGGGDVSDAYRVELDDGRVVFAKTHRSPPPHFFATEAAGLRWLRAADAVPTPEVVASSDDRPAFLVLEWIDEARRPPHDEAAFGRGLAALHGAGADAFGRTDRRTTGSLALPNDPCSSWAEFFGARRLLPLAAIARDRGALSERTVRDLVSVAERLEELAPPASPARLHGDLWAGNRVVDAHGESWLIDPAAHGGHREYDLAMMRLFGGFGDAAFAAYDESWPLDPGWEERVALHQLAPLTVHAIKFGASYVDATARAAAHYA